MTTTKTRAEAQRQREDEKRFDYAPPGLPAVARLLGRINSDGATVGERLSVPRAVLMGRGQGLADLERNSTLANSPGAGPRSIGPTRNYGIDVYGTELLALMNVEEIASDYRRRPVITTLPDIQSRAAEGSAFTAGTLQIDSAPPDADLTPGLFLTALVWSSQARAMASAAEWTGIDEAIRQHLTNAVMSAIFSDETANHFTGLWHSSMAAHAVERRNTGDSATRPAVTLEDVVALESRVSRTGQLHTPVVFICDEDVYEDLGATPRSDGDEPLRIGNRMLNRPIFQLDSTATGRDKMLACIAMGALTLTAWGGSLVEVEYIPIASASERYQFMSQCVLDVMKGNENVALSYSTV